MKNSGGSKGGPLEQGRGFWCGYADQNAIKEEVIKMINQIKEIEDR